MNERHGHNSDRCRSADTMRRVARHKAGETTGPADADSDRPTSHTRHITERADAGVMTSALESASAETEGGALIHETAAHLLRGAGDVDAGIGAAVRGAIIGAIDAGPHISVDRKDAAKAAAMGALEAAGDVGAQAAVERVKRIVTGRVNGIHPLDESFFAKGHRTP